MLPIQSFAQQLEKGISPITLFFGDEWLLIQQALNRLRNKAKSLGVEEIKKHYEEQKAPWGDILMDCQSLGLFSRQQLVEIHLKKVPQKEALQSLHKLIELADESTWVVVWVQDMDYKQAKAKWVKQLEQKGLVCQAKTIPIQQYPQWVQQHARQWQMHFEPEALNAFCHFVEGNLLAADQGLQKMAMLGQQTITLDVVNEHLADQAQYELFSLSDYLLRGDLLSAYRRLNRLQQSGTEPVLLSWLMARETRLIHQYKLNQASGTTAVFCQKNGLWQSRENQIRQAADRLSLPQLQSLHQQLLLLDAQIKGQQQGSMRLRFNQVVEHICAQQS